MLCVLLGIYCRCVSQVTVYPIYLVSVLFTKGLITFYTYLQVISYTDILWLSCKSGLCLIMYYRKRFMCLSLHRGIIRESYTVKTVLTDHCCEKHLSSKPTHSRQQVLHLTVIEHLPQKPPVLTGHILKANWGVFQDMLPSNYICIYL